MPLLEPYTPPPNRVESPYAAAFVEDKCKGPGDARPTAAQIIETQGLVGKLRGRVALVTGCSPDGLGAETARALHYAGADVFLTVRSREAGERVKADILGDGGPGAVTVLEMSLDSLASVRAAARELLAQSPRLDIAVYNAGVMACPEGRTKDGFETQFGTNHLGHFLLFNLTKDAMIQASKESGEPSRLVVVSSSSHRGGTVDFDDLDFAKRGYSPWGAYAQSKTATIWFANHVDRTYAPSIRAFSLNPGGIATPLQRHQSAEWLKNAFDPHKNPLGAVFGKNVPQGAATSVWAAVGRELAGRGALYLEDCQHVGAAAASGSPLRVGHAAHAFSGAAAEDRLARVSAELVGLGQA